MTLSDFIISVCKEIIIDDKGSSVGNNKISANKQPAKARVAHGGTKQLITEQKLKEMIKNNSASQLTGNEIFTPLAKDLWQSYKNRA